LVHRDRQRGVSRRGGRRGGGERASGQRDAPGGETPRQLADLVVGGQSGREPGLDIDPLFARRLVGDVAYGLQVPDRRVEAVFEPSRLIEPIEGAQWTQVV